VDLEKVAEAAAKKQPFDPTFFSVADRHGLRDGPWVINRLSTTQNYPQW